MHLLDKLIGVVAPHNCIGCGLEGDLLCGDCQQNKLILLPSFCYICKKETKNSAICSECAPGSSLKSVHIGCLYDGPANQLVQRLKFDRARAAAATMARRLNTTLPALDTSILITNVPTATSRIRQRGYDQAALLASALASQRGLAYKPTLAKTNQLRQVGASRQQRQTQSGVSFRVTSPKSVLGRHILLVDDVLTTGASLEACAKLLIQKGALSVRAAVFAHKL